MGILVRNFRLRGRSLEGGSALRVEFPDTGVVNSVYSLTVSTGSGKDCGMDSGGIYLMVDGVNHEHCDSGKLDNPGDDLQPGGTDVYTGRIPGTLRNHKLPQWG